MLKLASKVTPIRASAKVTSPFSHLSILPISRRLNGRFRSDLRRLLSIDPDSSEMIKCQFPVTMIVLMSFNEMSLNENLIEIVFVNSSSLLSRLNPLVSQFNRLESNG